MECATCQHQSWHHSTVTYPKLRYPCQVCVRCDSAPCHCLQGPKKCPCSNLNRAKPEPVDRYTQDREAGGL